MKKPKIFISLNRFSALYSDDINDNVNTTPPNSFTDDLAGSLDTVQDDDFPGLPIYI